LPNFRKGKIPRTGFHLGQGEKIKGGCWGEFPPPIVQKKICSKKNKAKLSTEKVCKNDFLFALFLTFKSFNVF
jgi:hypothetical protein